MQNQQSQQFKQNRWRTKSVFYWKSPWWASQLVVSLLSDPSFSSHNRKNKRQERRVMIMRWQSKPHSTWQDVVRSDIVNNLYQTIQVIHLSESRLCCTKHSPSSLPAEDPSKRSPQFCSSARPRCVHSLDSPDGLETSIIVVTLALLSVTQQDFIAKLFTAFLTLMLS